MNRILKAGTNPRVAFTIASVTAALASVVPTHAAAVITSNDLAPFQTIVSDNMPVIFAGFTGLAVIAGGYGLALRAVTAFKRLKAPRI
jgi:hypothetical protein